MELKGPEEPGRPMVEPGAEIAKVRLVFAHLIAQILQVLQVVGECLSHF